MRALPAIAVTGSSGAVGGYVAANLARRGIPQRLLVRNPARAPQLPNSSIHRFSYSHREAAIAGIGEAAVLFMVSASESAERLDEHRAFVDAAASAGVKHVVYTSFAAAAADATFTLARDHHITEEYIKESGMGWTFLRDGFYIDFMEALVGQDGVIRGPAGDGRAAFVARADVSRAAAAVLAEPGRHVGRTYDLTGPAALTLTEVAETLSRIRGEKVSYHPETIEEAYRSRAAFNAPQWQVDAWVTTYTAIGSGVMSRVSPDIEKLTGLAPISLETYLREMESERPSE